MAKSNPFQDEHIVITGASSGIGKAVALALAPLHCKIGLIARRQRELESLAESIREQKGTVAFAIADVSNRQELQQAIAYLRDQHGPIDRLIANAGVGTPTLIDPINIHDVETMVRINLMGVIYSIEAVLPEMLARKKGHIAAISSLAALAALPGEGGYCSSKSAVNAFMTSLRLQLRACNIPQNRNGIAVTTICPGFIATPMTDIIQEPMPFLRSADQAAKHILYALRNRKRFYAFPWQMAWLTRLLPWLPDWLISKIFHKHLQNPPMMKIN